MKLAIIVGHTDRKRGAVAYNGITEYEYNSIVAERLNELIPCDSKVFFRDRVGIRGAYKNAAEWGADTSIELHFNSFQEKAYGAEILILSGQSTTWFLACTVITHVAQKLGICLRHSDGIKKVAKKKTLLGWKKDRGYKNLAIAKELGIANALLIEPTFCNFKTLEAVRVIENPESYAQTLCSAFSSFVEENA